MSTAPKLRFVFDFIGFKIKTRVLFLNSSPLVLLIKGPVCTVTFHPNHPFSKGGIPYLNNRVLPSKALSCDRLPEEIWCSQQILGNLWHIGPEIEGLYCFYCTALNFERKLAKTGTMRWKVPAEERHYRITWSISTNGSAPKFSVVL